MRVNCTIRQASRLSAVTAARARSLLPRLVQNIQGVSVLELAVVTPFFLSMSLYGLELTNMAVVNMQVTQIASSISDNASRLGQTDNSGVTPTVNESQIDTVMGGALRQGAGINIETNGRIILSSLEKDQDSGRQYIHWQRCRGSLDKDSHYGAEGAGLTGETIEGLGNSGRIITAADANSSSVMFAEVYYEYQGIFGDLFVGNVTFKEESAFEIRDDRNLSPGVTGSAGNSQCQ